jgi:hypothetical protein
VEKADNQRHQPPHTIVFTDWLTGSDRKRHAFPPRSAVPTGRREVIIHEAEGRIISSYLVKKDDYDIAIRLELTADINEIKSFIETSPDFTASRFFYPCNGPPAFKLFRGSEYEEVYELIDAKPVKIPSASLAVGSLVCVKY